VMANRTRFLESPLSRRLASRVGILLIVILVPVLQAKASTPCKTVAVKLLADQAVD